MLKAAHLAAAEVGVDYQKRVAQHHFAEAVPSVLEANRLMMRHSPDQGGASGAGE